ncbi:hypothetical protein AHAS_Ahas09G0165400 [Arachis hypogaea]
MVAGNITKKIQILSTPIHGDLLQRHKMSKRIIWDIFLHHKMIQVILMHLTVHTPLIKSHHHLSKPSIHLCKIVQPHLPFLHLKILHQTNYPSTQNFFQNSQSTQTFMNQSLSKLEIMFEKYEKEAQISWNEQENSFKNIEVLVNQMISAREEVKEQNEEAPELTEDPFQKSRELLKRQE